MKKVVLVAVVAVMATLTSCKKEYTCSCTTTDNGTVIAESKVTGTMKKSEAEDWCTGNAVTVGTTKMECKLD